MIPIAVDWNAIRAEYIGGGISYRKLAAKHGVSFNTLKDRAVSEGWSNERENTHNRVTTEAQQRVIEAAADNATIAAELKKRLLLRLKRTEEKLPMDATEVQMQKDGKKVIYKLRDITAAYRDLTADMVMTEQGNELLTALMELERRHG